MVVVCPVCSQQVKDSEINSHLDSECKKFVLGSDADGAAEDRSWTSPTPNATQNQSGSAQKRSASTFFQTPAAKRQQAVNGKTLTPIANGVSSTTKIVGVKRTFDEGPGRSSPTEVTAGGNTSRDDKDADATRAQVNGGGGGGGGGSGGGGGGGGGDDDDSRPAAKRTKTNRAAPLAERMRPQTLDDVYGQELVGPNGVLRALIESDRVPSMILWGGSGTGKTTIARCIAHRVGSRFVELNATSTGVAECKRLFGEAANELALTGRRTIVFCDEIHRFSKAQQDVFLKPVESGTITLVGATTENPSFKVQAALLSRCRTFTLHALALDDVQRILARAVHEETDAQGIPRSPLIDDEMLAYLAAFADGDARTALNLLELALSLAGKPAAAAAAASTTPASSSTSPSPPTQQALTKDDIKAALTKTLVYDRAGDQHYDNISAFHKSVRGSDADAALYYLARMLQSGEDPVFIARRMVVIASEDVGLADNTLLPLATAAFTAAQQIGMPEARIPLAHCAVALCRAPKSTRAYRALNNAYSALQEPGVAALPVPVHLRNAPTRLMRDLGYGAQYKYPPNYRDGRVRQEYLPEALRGRRFLEDRDLGTEVDPDLEMEDA